MKKLFIVLSLVLFTVSLSACQKDDEGTQGVTETTVLVGNSAATSGGLAFVGLPFNAGIEAYFAMINADGGVNGRRIEFIHYDDQFNGATGLIYAERLVEDDEIFAFVGHFGTPIIGATETYLEGVGIPRVYYATGVGTLYNEEATGNERASFPVQPVYPAEGQVMVARAIGDFGAEKIGVIYSNDDSGTSMLEGVEAEALRQGITLVIVEVEYNAPDLSAAALTIVNAEVDFIIVAANQVSAGTAIKALEVAGSDVDCITSYVNASPSFAGLIKDTFDNFDVYASAWVDFFEADGETFTAEYNLFATEMATFNNDYIASVYAMTGWIAASFFVEGLERVGTDELTWDSFIDAMEETPIQNPFGGTIDFADGSRVGTESMSLTKAVIIPASGDVAETYIWNVISPLETITDILGD